MGERQSTVFCSGWSVLLPVAVALAGGLLGCGGGAKALVGPGGDAGTNIDAPTSTAADGDGGDDEAALALFQTTTRSGSVQLPAGSQVSLSSLTVQSTVDQQAVSSSGTFTLGTYVSPGQIVIVEDAAGNPMLMGWLDATHTVISADSTAQLLLWLGSGAQSLPSDAQAELLPTVESTPGLAAVTQAISTALAASPDAFATPNAAVATAVHQVLAAQMLPPRGSAIPFALTITSTTPGMQSGLDVIQDGSFSAHIQNTYLRRAWADIRRVSETTSDGQGNTTTKTYSPAVQVSNFEVPPIAGYGGLLPTIGQFANYIGGASTDTPATPVSTPPFSLPLTAGSSQTTYKVTIMGWGGNLGAEYANLDNVQIGELTNICVQAFFEDGLLPIISSIILGQEQVLGGASANSFKLRVIKNFTADVTGSDTLQPFVKAISQGQLTNALATVFYNGGDVPTAAASNLIRQFIADAFEQALKQEAAVNASLMIDLPKGVNFLGKLNSFANAAGAVLEGANLAAMMLERPVSDNADAWMVNATSDKVAINPNPVVVAPGGMTAVTASVLDSVSSGYTYRWGGTAANGTLSGPGSETTTTSNGFTYYCSSSATATYTANPNAAPTNDADTISVDVFAPYTDDGGATHVSALCQGQPIGSKTVAVQIKPACWDAVKDFSSKSNPNGPWQYGSLSGTTLSLLNAGGCNMLSGWQGMSVAPGQPPFIYAGTGRCGSTAEAVPSATLYLHPAQNGDRATVRWTAPSAGTYTIQGTFVGMDPAPTTTDVHVVLGGVDSFTAQIDSLNVPSAFSLKSVPVTAGETVDFEVGFGANGNYVDDSTGLTATICP